MDINSRIEAFIVLGRILEKIGRERSFVDNTFDLSSFEKEFYRSIDANAWFTPDSIFNMLGSLGGSLNADELRKWAGMYDLSSPGGGKNIAVVMAGNVPAVGFHDFLSVMMAGHDIQAKLSSDDPYLMPAIARQLIDIEPAFQDRISFTEGSVKGFDAVIATGSNNTSRYFNYYFGKYPHIIRKNRNALAVLTGEEKQSDLEALGDDIFMYYGLGCRNVSKLFVPREYDFKVFFEAIECFSIYGDHHKYRNNYDYNKSVLLVNGEPHFDNGFLLLREYPSMASAVSVLHYERYDSSQRLNDILADESDNIQCVVSISKDILNSIPTGTAQYPRLWDYADGIDTMKFLLSL